jgi:hypothetical protein
VSDWDGVIDWYLYHIGALHPCETCGADIYRGGACPRGCDEPCVCHTDFTCMSKEHDR